MILSLLISVAFASDSWLCTTQASKVQGDQILVCGIGIGKDEATARQKALAKAKEEFNDLCDLSDSCRDHEVSVTPGRTSCETINHGYKCHRLLSFTIGDGMSQKAMAKEEAETPQIRTTVGTVVNQNKDYTMDDFWHDWNNKYLKPH